MLLSVCYGLTPLIMFYVAECLLCLLVEASAADVLAQLVNLLKEFYTTTDNCRKKEIGKRRLKVVN